MFHLLPAVRVLLCHQIQMFPLMLREVESEVMLNKVLNSKIHSHREILNRRVEEVLKDRIILKELIPREEMTKVDNKLIMVCKEMIPKQETDKMDNKTIMVRKEIIPKEEMVKVNSKIILMTQMVYLVELKTILMVQMVHLMEKELLHKSYRIKQENLEKLLLM